MIGIKGIASYLPSGFIDNLEQGRSFGETEVYIRNRIGAWKLPRKAENEDTSDLCVNAVRNLLGSTSLTVDAIEVIALVTQNGDGDRVPHTSPIVQQKLALNINIAAFDISLGCSGYVYGLAILKGFMEASNLKNGVLITCDPYSKIIDPADRGTTLLFGDAATATWIGEGAEWAISPPMYLTDGSLGKFLQVEDGILQMNGRKIYNFVVSNTPDHIRKILDRESLKPEDIDLYCLHQGSAAMLETVSRKFDLVKDRFVIDMAETGNTVSSSIPLLIEEHINGSGIRRILISGFGVGLSLATTILCRRN